MFRVSLTITENYENRTVLALKDLHLLKLVKVGDFVISLRSFQGGIEYAREQGIISPAYTILYPVDEGHHAYLAKLFKSKPFIENLNLYVTGIRQGQNIDYVKLSRSSIPLPPLDEQRAIAHYLDWADARIRRLIRARQRQIQLLEEYKQALIHQAVTGQVDVRTGQPYPAYKDSGVEWLGKVPAHWEVRQVKRYYQVELGKMLDSKAQDGELLPYLNAANIHWGKVLLEKVNLMRFTKEQKKRYRLKYGDLLVTEGGATLGRSAIWYGHKEECYYQNSLNRVRSKGKLPNGFLYYWIYFLTHSGFIETIVGTATFGHLTKEKLSNLEMVVPPTDEASRIIDFLDEIVTRVEKINKNIKRNIDLLREYRTRLIADVVTGKIDVRAAAARLAEELEALSPEEALELDEDEEPEEEEALEEAEVLEE
ncbi:MAG: restriction modification system DNA specificity domain-containing protein [Litorilinea sp.]|nr:MAG: restriction modification system DNA specificity domain-containing protein [Litorilinea sp.]